MTDDPFLRAIELGIDRQRFNPTTEERKELDTSFERIKYLLWLGHESDARETFILTLRRVKEEAR